MSKDRCEVEAYFQTSDNEDGSFWIWVSEPNGKKIGLGDCNDIMVGLHLERSTSIHEADDLAALLRKHVKTISLQTK